MSVKDKENKSFRKLKQFFGLNKGGIASLRNRQDFILTPEMEQQLKRETPVNQRSRAIKELCDQVKENCVEYKDMEKLRVLLEDLFLPETPREARHQGYAFYRCLIAGQYERLNIMRVHVFNVIRNGDIAEDVPCQLELLNALTENGKVIEHLEEEIGYFLQQWLPAVVTAGKTQEFLALLVNIVKYNAAYIDDDVIMKLNHDVCYLCCWMNSRDVVMGCLQVLDSIVRYSNLPPESLQDFVSALCRTVNIEAYCQESWKIMRNLLGTHMGHAALYTMCQILQNDHCQQDSGLMRGAVFYINMGLWGNKRVPSLVCTETSVLPSLLQAASAGQAVVVYEVMLSCERLVNKYGLELQDSAWDLLLCILETVIKHIEAAPQPSSTSLVAKHLHDTLCMVEKLVEHGQFNGSVEHVFEIIESCSSSRPELSVMRLVTYHASSILPTRDMWLAKLHALLDKFFRNESRTSIKIKVLSVLDKVIETNRATYEDELIEQAVVPFLANIDQDQDVLVRKRAADLLIELCLNCDSKRCIELLDILEKLLNRPFEPLHLQTFTDADLADVCTVAKGVVRIFIAKMYQLPSSHAVHAYKLLVNHLDTHYEQNFQSVLDHQPAVRYAIFECFLRIRANSLYQLGFPGGPTATPGKPLIFSPYLGVDHKHGERTGGASSPPPVSPAPTPYPLCVFTTLSLTYACKAVITALTKEKDWKVLQLILTEIPEVMKNKALILSRHANDIDSMAAALCSIIAQIVNDKNQPDNLRNTPPKFNRTEFQSYLFPVLSSLSAYHNHLDPTHQRRLILSLEWGLQTRCTGHVVGALTTCTLEMKDAMYKLLPEVLLNLSKISDTVQIAFPILSFLSTLTRLPKVFASFVGDQYMSVMAISLPYSNPFKYNHFIVSLAHHVIAVWFLKCRLKFRKDFVRFITTSLKSNVRTQHIEEGHTLRQDPLKMELLNEDSSSRKRSSSLTEQGSRRRALGSRLDPRLELKPAFDESLITFHMELTETCIDLMARYTFSTCSAMPKRLPAVQSLLSGGQSMTWLLGNRLITVTTSGCNQKVMRSGLCDKCLMTCCLPPDATSPIDGSELDVSISNQSQTSDRSSARVVEQFGKVVLQRSSSVDVTASSGREEASSASAAASSITGGSTRNLQLLMQVPQSGNELGSTGSLQPAVSSPTEEHRRLSSSLETIDPESSKLDQLIHGVDRSEQLERQLCSCWCNGWAEIHVRRPTGDMSWVMRLQNQNSHQDLSDVPTLFLPSLMRRDTGQSSQSGTGTGASSSNRSEINEGEQQDVTPANNNTDESPAITQPAQSSVVSEPVNIPASPVRCSPSRQSSRDSLDEEEECEPDTELDDGSGRARNPVRRSNSSPEMSAGWRNPFLTAGASERGEKMEKMTKLSYSKDLRANCEAIPEEIAGLGTTPPSTSPIVARLPNSEPAQKIVTASSAKSTVVPSTETPQTDSPITSSQLKVGGGNAVLAVGQGQGPGQGQGGSALRVNVPSLPTASNSYQATPLLLPSALAAKPPLSPTQTRHAETEQKSKLTASPNTVVRDRAPTIGPMSGRLSSGSASSSVGGSTSSLDSKANTNTDQLQLQLDRRLQQTSAPASPTTSHAHHLSASAERINREDVNMKPDPAALPPLAFKRDRGHTISVMSPARKPGRDWDMKRNKSSTTSPRMKDNQQRSSVNPNLVFLQLFHSSYFGSPNEKPVLVSNSAQFQRSIKILDLTPPYETHKVGVLYIKPGQTNSEQEILRNTTGSLRYTEFLQRLGSLTSLEDPDPHLYLGGLETSKDGKFAYFWQDDVTQVTFHVATLMPTRESDPSCNDKKRHIGNNFVTIVYNESGEDYNMQTVKGQFNYACVEIQPLDHSSNQVIVRTRDELAELGFTCEAKIISDLNLAILARQLALHANLASNVLQSLKFKGGGNIYASNWLERLRLIKRMRTRTLQDLRPEDHGPPGNNADQGRTTRLLPDDFIDYT